MPSANNIAVDEWCRQQLANLQIADRRTDALAEIRNHLTTQPASSSGWLSTGDIFNCIREENNREQTTLACDILSICMTNLTIVDGVASVDSASEAATKRHQLLLQCLAHENADVRLIGLNEIERSVNQPQAFDDDSIIVAMIDGLRFESERVSVPTIKLLARILPDRLADGGDPTVRARLLATTTTHEAGISPSIAHLIKCRVYELAVTIAAQSAAALNAVAFLLAGLVADLQKNGDILLQMNVLELMTDLAVTDQGFEYVENSGCLKAMMHIVERLNEVPLGNMLAPGYIKFFGALVAAQPDRSTEAFPLLIAALFSVFSNDDDADELNALLPVALDTLGHLARSDEGTIRMQGKYARELEITLRHVGRLVNGWPTSLQVRALNCLENMLRADSMPPNNHVRWVQQNALFISRLVLT